MFCTRLEDNDINEIWMFGWNNIRWIILRGNEIDVSYKIRGENIAIGNISTVGRVL